MTRITYEQAFADHTYLWDTYGPANDMTGGYVDQGDLDRLLKSPTKATAKGCLCNQIVYWFQVGPDHCLAPHQVELDRDDPILQEIAERHGQELP